MRKRDGDGAEEENLNEDITLAGRVVVCAGPHRGLKIEKSARSIGGENSKTVSLLLAVLEASNFQLSSERQKLDGQLKCNGEGL